MIQIYKRDNTNFEQNGDAVLTPLTCSLEVKLNGTWELQLEHPLDSDGVYKNIETGAVIAAPSFVSEKQLFRIYNTDKSASYIMAYARPIFLDSQEDCFLLDKRPTNENGQGALDALTEGTKYSGTSDIEDIHTAYYVGKNLMEAIAGNASNAFLNLWGGEVLYDNFNIIINKAVGSDHGVQAKFGRNITGIHADVNMDGVITRIIPIAYNGYKLEGAEPWVDSPLIDNYSHPYIQEVKFSNIKLQEDCLEGEEGFANLAALREELIRQCNLMYEGGCDKPTCNYSIDIVDLSQTEEYKDFKALETISLGDVIECGYEPLGIATKARVIQLTYDCINKRNESVELGDFKYDYFVATSGVVAKVESVIDDSGNVIAERVKGVLDALTTQLKYQKNAAQKQDVRAILFEDTNPGSELYGAMCLGTQGFQIANKMLEDGSDWDWSTAFTANGGYANTLIAGILKDKLGKSYWNLDTGELVLSGGTDIGGKSVEEIIQAVEAAEKAELAVTSVKVMYALGDSTTTAPTSGWSTTAPAWVDGKYMWQKTVTTYANGTEAVSDATCISGATGQAGADGKDGADGAKGDKGDKGDTGATGATGASGVGIKSIVEQYYLSSSKTAQTGGSWSTTPPTWKSGYYIWTRSYITWTNGTTGTTTPVLANALNAVSENATNASNILKQWCYNNDTTYINGGKIYAKSITATEIDIEDVFAETITIKGNAWVYPTAEDVDLIRQYILKTATLTSAQISLYDFNCDGKVDVRDMAIAKSLSMGKVLIDNYPNYTKRMSEITVTIDASNPEKTITLSGTSSFGRDFEYYFGINGTHASSVVAEGVVAGALDVSGEASFADTVSASAGITCAGTVTANNMTVANGQAYQVMNSSGEVMTIVGMTAADNMVLGSAGDNASSSNLYIGSSATTSRTYMRSAGRMDFNAASRMDFNAYGQNNNTNSISIAGSGSAPEFRACTNNVALLGSSSYKWKAVYAVNGTIQTSDRNLKRDIVDLNEDTRFVELFDKLTPVSYKMVDGERTHVGFVSQDVKAAMDECGISDKEFAGYCRDRKYINDPETDEIIYSYDADGNPEYVYSLRYDEFVALNTMMIHQTRKENAELREELASLKAEMSELKALIANK